MFVHTHTLISIILLLFFLFVFADNENIIYGFSLFICVFAGPQNIIDSRWHHVIKNSDLNASIWSLMSQSLSKAALLSGNRVEMPRAILTSSSLTCGHCGGITVFSRKHMSLYDMKSKWHFHRLIVSDTPSVHWIPLAWWTWRG